MAQPFSARFLELVQAREGKALPTVDRWNPDYCGQIDMRIAKDGRWFYQGTTIERMPLVRLFASILRRDPDRYVLVTPVERVGIIVDDLPFLAVEMESHGAKAVGGLSFRTNLDDIVTVDAAHPLHLEIGPNGEFRPRVLVRGRLWARLTRPLAFELADLVEEGSKGLGLRVGELWFPLDSQHDS
jgi:hypothetical protein